MTYCQSFLCPASARAYEYLEELGYTDLREYSGGVEDWRAHGLPLANVEGLKLSPFLLRLPDATPRPGALPSYLFDLPEKLLLVNGPQTLTEENEDFIRSFDKPVAIYLTPGAPARRRRTPEDFANPS